MEIYIESIWNCRSYGLDKNLTFKCDLDLGPIWTNISNCTSTYGEQLCQIILKSIHNCRSYGPDKIGLTHASTNTLMLANTNTKLWLCQLCLAHHKLVRQKYRYKQTQNCTCLTYLHANKFLHSSGYIKSIYLKQLPESWGRIFLSHEENLKTVKSLANVS